uniref:dolichyl-phosphate-mannose--protein mannosyltransferase n=2 Tax=Magallana gigas TaxID=29159 RepID=A0A8W8J3J0_MAGGI
MDPAVLVSSALSFVLYLNSLDADFAYDDSRAIKKNQDLLPETPLINLFYDDFWGTPLTHSGSHKSYRPLCVLSFRLNYFLGEFSPWGYHLGNVLLHVLVTAIFTKLVRIFLRDDFPTFTAGLLFAAHPVHTEAVAGIVGRADVGACLFFLLAFLCYIKYVKYRDHVTGSDAPFWGLLCILGTAIFTTASMLTKEQGVTVIAVCATYDLFVNNKVQITDIISFKWLGNKKIREGILYLAVIGFLLVAFRIVFMGNKPPEFAPSDNPASDSDSAVTRFLTYILLPVLNVWILNGNGVSHHGNSTPKYIHNGKRHKHSRRGSNSSTGSEEDPAETGFTLYKSQDIAILSLSLMVFPFIPATNLFFYVGFVIAERVLYIPSMGFCLLVSHGANCLYKKYRSDPMKKKCILGCVGLLLMMYSGRTVLRNKVWQSEENLYSSGLSTNPAKAWGNLANVWNQQGRKADAEQAYRNALKHRGNMADTHYNLGILLQDQKRTEEAVESYKRAIQYRPKLSMAHLNLAIIYASQGRYADAEKIYRHCADLDTSGLKDPRLHENTKISALYNLGRMLSEQERNREAVEVYKEALRRRPSYYAPQSIYNMLGEVYMKTGQTEEAERWYKEALKAKADHIPAHLTMAKLLHKKNQIKEAEEWFKKAKLLDPDDTMVDHHYAQFLGETSRLKESSAMYRQAIQKSPNDFELVFNAANILRQDGDNEASEKLYEKAVQLKPNVATAHMNLGAMYHFNGKLEKAEQSYLEALKLKPDDATTQQNLVKLRNLMQSNGRQRQNGKR